MTHHQRQQPVAADGPLRGAPLNRIELVIEKVTAALARKGGSPYSGYAQAVIVEALAL